MTGPVSVTITEQSGAGKVALTITLDGVDSRCTLRDLIRTRVREEAARAGTGHGWEKQADKALESFGRNGFFVLVGDRQVTDLDSTLELSADTDIRFIRLVPLAGG